MENQPFTTVAQAQQKADLLKKEICLLLNWTEMQFAEYQYRNGIAYLMWYLPCDERGRYLLERSRMYWNWFKIQWTGYDESFLSYRRSLKECTANSCLAMYEELHCPRALAHDKKPNDVVLESLKIAAI